jgi:hypothetical protein
VTSLVGSKFLLWTDKGTRMTLDELETLRAHEAVDPNLHTALVRAALATLPDLIKIARAVAALEGINGPDGCWACPEGGEPHRHHPDCVWLLARKLGGDSTNATTRSKKPLSVEPWCTDSAIVLLAQGHFLNHDRKVTGVYSAGLYVSVRFSDGGIDRIDGPGALTIIGKIKEKASK